MSQTLIELKGLKKHFYSKNRFFDKRKTVLKAVDGIDLSIYKGETLGLVGESGCGKSTVGRLIMGLASPSQGDILLGGQSLNSPDKAINMSLRKQIQLIFQDPFGSLNPHMTVKDILLEPLKAWKIPIEGDLDDHITYLLEQVGLSGQDANRYPADFSGGQRQRIAILRALSVEPKLIICDEPTSALDVSIQAQVINLLKTLQEKRGLTYLFISHDLLTVRYLSDRIGVMYLGKIVELSPTDALYTEPKHPYTQALLSAIALPDPDAVQNRPDCLLKGEVPSPFDIPSGCPFRTRCPQVMKRCQEEVPLLKSLDNTHYVACHLYGE